MGDQKYLRRFVDDFLDATMPHLPAFMITGPRASGKTTTGLERAVSVLRLDDPAVAELVHDELDRYLARLEPPALIDEWQFVPEILGAVKRAVDTNKGSGRFLITGSVRARHMQETWPGTGRFTPIKMHGLTQAERQGNMQSAQFVDWLFEGTLPSGQLKEAPATTDYLRLAAQGGFPEAVYLPSELQARWYEGYVEELMSKDVAELAELKRPHQMLDVLKAAALNTAGLPQVTSLMEAASTSRYVMDKYLTLLEELFVLERLPAWGKNKFTRMSKTPKLHFLDTGLAMWLAGTSPRALERDADLRGRILDSFVAAQLRPLVALSSRTVRSHHFRDRNGEREIDLLLEARDGSVAGIEVKASRRVTRKDARHLEWFRDQVGSAFTAGVVLHTGDYAAEIADRVWLMPICALWDRTMSFS